MSETPQDGNARGGGEELSDTPQTASEQAQPGMMGDDDARVAGAAEEQSGAPRTE